MKKISLRQLKRLAHFFDVLSEPSRLCLLYNLRKGPMNVEALTKACKFKQANVSKQLAILRQANFVQRERKGNSIYYHISNSKVLLLCEQICGKFHPSYLPPISF